MHKGLILIVDDEANARTALAELLREEGYSVETAADGFKALGKLDDFGPDVVLTDLKMPGMSGLELLRKIRARREGAIIVVMTAFGEVETAVAAMKEGAADYLTKPLDMTKLLLVLGRERERQQLRVEADHLRARLADRYAFANIVGSAPQMQDVFKTVTQVAGSRAGVLITGESGTGKGFIAAAIHERSPRARGPFVKLPCAVLAETLLESELFGHERGAFTGALGRREGRLVQAHGGTLFLDEIGEISTSVQVKLLRFLQEHALERVGGNETLHVDVRVIAATNRDLKAAVASGRFREDLYYRLDVIGIHLPPLRERRTDVPLLAMHFLGKFAAENQKEVTGFTEDALARLCAYDWPGNVRELENIVERAVILAAGPKVDAADFPPRVGAGPTGPSGIRIPGSSLDDIERYAILAALEATGGSTSKAAEMLGVSVRKVQYKLHQYATAPKAGGEIVASQRVVDPDAALEPSHE